MTSEISRPFSVTITARARHALLLSAVREYGSVKALADHIGVNAATLSNWINLKSTPGRRKGYKSGESVYLKPKVETAVARLCAVCKCSANDLFPDWLDNQKLKAVPTRVEVTQEVSRSQIESAVADPVAMLPAPEDVILHSELVDRIDEVLKTIPSRERLILQMRYGLNGEEPKNLTEVANFFKVTRERVKQIEMRALRKLQHPVRARQFESFLDIDSEATDG